MRVYSTKDFNWNKKELYLGDEKTGFGIEPELSKPFLFWRVRYPDGILSQDYYNSTRAKENTVLEARRHLSAQLEDKDPVSDALK